MSECCLGDCDREYVSAHARMGGWAGQMDGGKVSADNKNKTLTRAQGQDRPIHNTNHYTHILHTTHTHTRARTHRHMPAHLPVAAVAHIMNGACELVELVELGA